MSYPILQSAQGFLDRHGLVPRSRLSRVCIVLAIIVDAWTLAGVRAFATVYNITALVLIGALLVLGYRVFSQRFMWRLRNRLIVTYVFIGVIPLVLLATMGVVAGYLFAGQFSTFVVTTDVRNELLRLESANRAMTHQAAAALRRQGTVDPGELAINNEAFPERRVTAYFRGRVINLSDDQPGGPSGGLTTAEPAPPPPNVPEAVLIEDNGELYLRAVNRAAIPSIAGGGELVLVSSVPLDKPHLESIVANMGIITLYGERSGSVGGNSDGNIKIPDRIPGDDSVEHVKVGKTEVDARPKVICGSMPPPVFGMDVDFAPFVTILNAVHWRTGEPSTLLLTVRTRPSLLYNRLFRTLGDSTNFMLLALVAIAAVFALIEIAALVIGVRLTRTMTSSVANLYDATQLVNQGDFTHRIEINSHDQLASLESSFNSMTESLRKLIAEQKEKQRIESELSIAKEVQDLLFPHDAADLDGLELHGVCRPARTVSGDYYDFLPVGPNAVGLAVGDISGKGISAALMMATVHAFVRAHTLAEQLPALAAAQNRVPAMTIPQSMEAGTGAQDGEAQVTVGEPSCCPSPGTVLALLNQQLYRSTPAQKYATMFLGFYDQQTRQLTYSNAGHLPPIVIRANGSTQLLDIGGTVVGLFGDRAYPEGQVTLNPGDIVVAYSDGITEPENEFGDFGEERLTQIVQENRDLPLPRISDAILAAVLDWIGGEEQPDDMTVVLARAR
jgi:sigma-B regulation protein RsbU (phosphoserine phosphatase)